MRIKTDDIIPYIYDEFGNPLEEDETFTVRWVERNIDKFGNKVIKKSGQDSVFDQLTDQEFETIMYRLKKLNRKNKFLKIKSKLLSPLGIVKSDE
jgi:hypothetical protein